MRILTPRNEVLRDIRNGDVSHATTSRTGFTGAAAAGRTYEEKQPRNAARPGTR